MKNLFLNLLLFSSSILLLSSCELIEEFLPKPKAKLTIYRGTPVTLGNGKATAWISVNHLGAPVELGLELTRESLYNLPQTNFSVAVVPLPNRAKELTPFEHIQIDWASQGHGLGTSNGIIHFGPHYDIRFFMTSLEERLSIPAPTDPSAKFNILPPTGYMPADYSPGLTNLPGLGKHWGDGKAFPGITNTIILGTYNGKFTFISPIITIEELQSGNNTSKSFSQPQIFQESNTHYPTKYNIYADDENEQNRQVTLSGFVLR